jgi:hypothetical protein
MLKEIIMPKLGETMYLVSNAKKSIRPVPCKNLPIPKQKKKEPQ